jgi:hypothetical protein
MHQFINPFHNKALSNFTTNTYRNVQTKSSSSSFTSQFAIFFGILSLLFLLFGSLFLFLRKRYLVEEDKNKDNSTNVEKLIHAKATD